MTRKFDLEFKTKLCQEIVSGKPEACVTYELSRSRGGLAQKVGQEIPARGKPSHR